MFVADTVAADAMSSDTGLVPSAGKKGPIMIAQDRDWGRRYGEHQPDVKRAKLGQKRMLSKLEENMCDR